MLLNAIRQISGTSHCSETSSAQVWHHLLVH